MAVTQTVANRQGMAKVAVADSDGYYYLAISGWRWYTGSGSPNSIITAPLGSLYTRVDAAAVKLYQNTDAGTTWACIGDEL